MNRAKLQQVIAANPHFTATRKMSLYSNFARLEEINPDGFEANVAAWKEVLEDALRAGAFADSTCISAGPELIADLIDAENGMPLALNTVLDRMVADGTLVPLSRFAQAYPSTPSAGLGAGTARFLSWAIGLVHRPQWQSGGAEELRHEKYVDVGAVESTATQLVRALNDATSKQGNSRLAQVFSYDEAAAMVGSLSATDVECSLAYAAATGRLYFDRSRNIVKLRQAGAISDVDVTIVSLRSQISELEAREAALESQIDAYTAQARSAVKVNRKAAKQFLQKKAIAEKSFERTATLLDQLQSVLHKIDDASDNQQAYSALQSSSRVLAELNSATSVDDVEAVMEHLQDEIEQTDSVTESLADLRISSDAASTELDELEIDAELGEMEAEAHAKETDAALDHLPTAPKHRPGEMLADPAKEAAADGSVKEPNEKEAEERTSEERTSEERTSEDPLRA